MNVETWSGALATLRSIRPWQIAVLIVVLIGAGAGTYAAYSYFTASESTELEEDQQLIPVQRGDLVKQVSISGSVSFPNRETLTFGSAGIVDELLVEEGERVVEGQKLATLDAETIAGLEEAAAKARVDLRDAEQALDDYLEPPSELSVADARHKVAEAELSLQTATEALEQILKPTEVEVTDAEAKIASLLLDLQNAEDKLDELLEPTSLLDLEKAQADVESAGLAVESVLEALSTLLEPQSEHDVAKQESRIDSARIALEKAKDDLANLQVEPSSLDVARAESRVETARVALDKVKDELDGLLEPPTNLEIAQAKSRIAQAELALEKAEEAEEAAWEVDELAVADAKSSIAKLELAAENVKEALDELVQGPSSDEVDEATQAIERAKSDLDILREEMEIARRDRELNLDGANERVEDAAEDYALEFLEWLGMEVDVSTIDPDPEVALESFGIDLAILFGSSNQLAESPYIGIHRESFPPNDPSTPWNEFTVYAWLNLHFATVVGVCEPEDVPSMGHCVQEEFRIAGDKYQLALDNLETVDSQTARMVSDEESAEQKALDGLENAEQALEDLQEPPDPLVIAEHEADLALARVKVTDAQQALEDLLAPMDSFLVKEKEAGLAAATLEDAWQAYEDLVGPADPTDIANKEVEIEAARVNLADAQQAVVDLFAPVDPLVVTAGEAAVESAMIALADEEQALADLLEPPDDLEVEKRNLDLNQAQIDLRKAEEDLAELLETADDVTISDQRMQIALIRANIVQAEEDLAELKSGESHSEYRERQEDIEGARLDLEQRQEELADIEGQSPEQVDVDFLRAAISSARAAVEQADRLLADSTLEAPWNGFVSQVNVEQGQSVQANASVLELVDTDVIEIDGSVDEIDVLSIAVGAEAAVTMDALPGQSIPGAVSFLGAEAQSQQGIVSYPIGVQLQPPDDVQLPEGLSAVATITIGQDLDVLLVPVQAVRGSFDQPTVGVMVDGQIVETPVTLGSSDDFWTVVTDGVEEGDQIVMTTQVGEDAFGGFGSRPRGGVSIRRVTR